MRKRYAILSRFFSDGKTSGWSETESRFWFQSSAITFAREVFDPLDVLRGEVYFQYQVIDTWNGRVVYSG